jgi:hypothetical protein
VNLAGAMTSVQAEYAITIVANTNSEDVERVEPELEVTAILLMGNLRKGTVTVAIRIELRR